MGRMGMGSNYSGGYGTPDGLGGYSKYKFSFKCLSGKCKCLLSDRQGARVVGFGLGGKKEGQWFFVSKSLGALHIVLLQQMLVKSSSAGVLLM